MEAPDILTGFIAGLLSFLSPCVLPLVPSYLSFVTGQTGADIRSGDADRKSVLLRTLAFVLGFTAVFMALGFALAGASGAMGGAAATFKTVAGGVVILLGLNLIFDFLKFLNREARFRPARKASSIAGAFAFGAAFGAGWSPCIGPILGSILFLAGTEGQTLTAALLLSAYSLGFALPFFAMALFFSKLAPLWEFLKKKGDTVRIISGLFLVGIGVFMVTGSLGRLNSAVFSFGYAVADALAANPIPFRVGGAIFWLTLSALVAVPRLIRRQKPGPARIAVAAGLAMAGILEAAGVISTAGALIAWLTWSV